MRGREPEHLAGLLREMAAALEEGSMAPPPGRDRARSARDLRRAAELLAPAPPQTAVSAPAEAEGDSLEELILHADGGARGNPGPAGAGAVLSTPGGRVLARLHRYLGRTTNNVAEYQALLMGLDQALALGARRLEVRLDSELVVKQLQGAYRVKSPHLKPLYHQVRERLRRFEHVHIIHVRRQDNQEADRLANLAMDQGRG